MEQRQDAQSQQAQGQQEQLPATGGESAEAMRTLIATLANNPQMSVIVADQSATLTRLREITASIEALNQQSAQKYADLAPLFLRAVRLASRVNADLNEVSTRIRSVRNMIEELHVLEQEQSEQDAQQ